MQLYDLLFVFFLFILVLILSGIQLIGRYLKAKSLVPRVQICILFLASVLFIGLQDLRFLIIICIIIISSYIIGITIGKNRENTHKSKSLMAIGVAIPLIALSLFKYFNFFASSLSRLIHADYVALNIILPIGISFYTFTAISYVVDVYRMRIDPEKNLVNIALYIGFFSKLVAGPIVRANDFLPQIKSYKGIEWRNFETGIQIFVFGLFKKIVLADHLNVFVNDVFKSPAAFSSGTILLAIISYSLQIYFDFSGYSDMAIGAAKIVGIDIKRNFNLPYISQNFSEFWNRWHISLSSWFKDYLYIPLGGNRKGTVRTYVNLMIVMIISGLWHGAGWTFIIWGALHGVMSCIHRLLSPTKWNNSQSNFVKVLRILLTFIIATCLWVVFRASDANNAVEIFKGLFSFQDGISQPFTWSFFSIACLIVSTGMAVIHSGKEKHKTVDGFYPIMRLNKVWSLTLFFIFVGLTILMGYFGNTAFIYGKF